MGTTTDSVTMETGDRRLIEDYLPLEVLNAIAAREKLHPRRYVEMVHYWPARRPISAVRAADGRFGASTGIARR